VATGAVCRPLEHAKEVRGAEQPDTVTEVGEIEPPPKLPNVKQPGLIDRVDRSAPRGHPERSQSSEEASGDSLMRFDRCPVDA
jgi:hypothetical protein